MADTQKASDEHFAFFKTATPIGRDLFVETYQDVARISQLLVAPLGAGYRACATNVISPESALEEYTKLFRQWEEVISRSVYFAKDVPEDRVAASMHLFLEVQKDAEVLTAIREEVASVNSILEPPSVVALVPPMALDEISLQKYKAVKDKCDVTDLSKIFDVDRETAWLLADSTVVEERCELNFNTPGITALLIKQVLMALSNVFDSIDEDQASLPSSWGQKYGVMETSAAAPGGATRRCGFSPHDILLVKMKGQGDEMHRMRGGLPSATVQALSRCLDVPVPGGAVTVSVQQYYALLDAHGHSEQVEHVLRVLLDLDQKDDRSALSCLDHVRIGASAEVTEPCIAAAARGHSLKVSDIGWRGRAQGVMLLSATVSPLASELTQLAGIPAYEADEGGEKGLTADPAIVMLICKRLMLAQAEAARSASSVAAGKQLEGALVRATKAVQGKSDPWKEDEEEREEKEEEEKKGYDQNEMLSVLAGTVPDPLLHSLLVDRAKYYVTYYQTLMAEMQYAPHFPEGEEEDPALSPALQAAHSLCDFVLAHNPYFARAYEVRSSVRGLYGLQEVEEQEMERIMTSGHHHEDVDEDEEGQAIDCVHLKNAAKDALAAFHLGGSSDLALAGVAEDACRQASRLGARQLYKKKMDQLRKESNAPAVAGGGDDDLPRTWLVQAYLCGYEPPSLALSVPLLHGDGEGGLSCDYLSQRGVRPPYKVLRGGRAYHGGSDDEGGMHDIDEEDLSSSPLSVYDPHLASLPMPPAPFVQAPVVSKYAEGEEIIVVGRTYDRKAFRLLRHLVTLLERSVGEGARGARSLQVDVDDDDLKKAGLNGMDRFVHMVDESGTPAATIEVETETDKLSFVQRCEGDGGNHHTVIVGGGKYKTEEKGADADAKWAHARDTAAGASEQPVVIPNKVSPCPHFSELVRLLRSPAAAELTGVTFNPDSRLVDDLRPVHELSESISAPIHARLLNLCSVAAYLLGDAQGAVKCLRASLELLPVTTEHGYDQGDRGKRLDPCGLIDSAIKLGALLCDMDEREEAKHILEMALEATEYEDKVRHFEDSNEEGGTEEYMTPGEGDLVAERKQAGLYGSQAVAMLHLAELAIHSMDLDQAQSTLHKASRLATKAQRETSSEGFLQGTEAQNTNSNIWTRFLRQLDANVTSLLGVVLFRKHPEEADDSLRVLKRACRDDPSSLYLHLCYGEVLSQAGDLVGSLACFHQANTIDPLHPLPFVNAARTYQQLNQTTTAKQHLDGALSLDPTFALTHVDVAQAALQVGKTQEALEILDRALLLARHVSDFLDVLTAKRVAELQVLLQHEGLYHPPAQNL